MVAPLAVAGWGLPLWTLACDGVMLLGAGLWIALLPELDETPGPIQGPSQAAFRPAPGWDFLEAYRS